MSTPEVSIGHKSIAAGEELKQLELFDESLKRSDNDGTLFRSTPLLGRYHRMLPHWHVLGEIFLRTLAIYLVVLIGVRLSGKREVGQMTPFDLTLLLLLSNSVQNAMTGPDTSLAGGIVAALTLLLMNYLIAEFSGGNRRFRKFVQGQPSLLIHDGQIILANMAKEHVSMDELERALREHGITTYRDVALGVLEVDGSISLLKYDDLNPSGHSHLARRKHIPKHE